MGPEMHSVSVPGSGTEVIEITPLALNALVSPRQSVAERRKIPRWGAGIGLCPNPRCQKRSPSIGV